jgi:hypothetical protein
VGGKLNVYTDRSEEKAMCASESAARRHRTYPTTRTTSSEITLPDELGRALGIAPGESVKVHFVGQRLILEPVHATTGDAHPPARGLLSEYFSDWEDINAFVAEERSGWEERDQLLEEGRQAIWQRFRQSGD